MSPPPGSRGDAPSGAGGPPDPAAAPRGAPDPAAAARGAGDIPGIPATLAGEMAELMRGWAWAETPVGPPERWPEMLRSSLSICLGTRFPIAIYWGPSLALFYNDAWRPILGTKHPWGLGRGAREVWPEIWNAIGPLFAQVVSTGVGTYSEDQLLPMHRHGFTEECYF
ncbi:MAG TPA: hypothetical protein VFS00_22990, partial [Polyangiaceae bacterium]|nr:hypothetical protein [Polyangiaceae bacterium]